jgi:hypothetical protein
VLQDSNLRRPVGRLIYSQVDLTTLPNTLKFSCGAVAADRRSRAQINIGPDNHAQGGRTGCSPHNSETGDAGQFLHLGDKHSKPKKGCQHFFQKKKNFFARDLRWTFSTAPAGDPGALLPGPTFPTVFSAGRLLPRPGIPHRSPPSAAFHCG